MKRKSPLKQRRSSILQALTIVPISTKSIDSGSSERGSSTRKSLISMRSMKSVNGGIAGTRSSVANTSPGSNAVGVGTRKTSRTGCLSLPSLKEATSACEPIDKPVEHIKSSICRIKPIGKGASGVVVLGCYVPTMKLIAEKEITLQSQEQRKLVTAELIAIQKNLTPIGPKEQGGLFQSKKQNSEAACEYIIEFYGAFREPKSPKVTILMEYMNAGSLQDFIERKQPMPDRILRHVGFCMLSALDYMHNHRLIHRDIKPGNVLLSRNGLCKVADMGLATSIDRAKSAIHDFKGTVKYMAPERISGSRYSFKSDVWSVGMILVTLAKGKYPYDTGDGFFGLEHDIMNKEIPEIPEASEEFRSLILWMLEKDPGHRCSAKDALKHPSIRNYEAITTSESFLKEWNVVCPVAKHFRNEDIPGVVEQLVMKSKQEEAPTAADPPEKGIVKGMIRRLQGSSSRFKRNEIDIFSKDIGVDIAVVKKAFEQCRLESKSSSKESSHQEKKSLYDSRVSEKDELLETETKLAQLTVGAVPSA